MSSPATTTTMPQQSVSNHTAELSSPASRSEMPHLEDLQLRDRSLSPGKSRKRQLPQESAASAPIRPWPGTHRVFPGARKHTAYDFDSPVAAISVLGRSHEMPVNKLPLQPEIRQITEEQLRNEVRTIYTGIVLVERKCVEIDRQQANNPSTLTNKQLQALMALHRTLLYEHHDFFLASQHPSASPALQRVASRYAMPARMWKHAIHSFLELLSHRLPEVLDHMLAFIYTAYSMMALLLESVPSFEDIWIECLGDLARVKMAVEESDRDREVWAGVARYWFNKLADKSPMVGRIQHHLAVLARPNILLQLFFYSKSLICVHPFPKTKGSILLLFGPCLEQKAPLHHPPLMLSFVRAHGVLFSKQSILSFLEYGYEFISFLETQIGRVGSKWREQGIYFASANFVSLFEYDLGSFIGKAFVETTHSPVNISEVKDSYYTQHSTPAAKLSLHPVSHSGRFQTSVEVISYASCFAFHTLALVLKHTGDKNVLPHVHVSLAFLWSLALVPEAMSYAQSEIPWQALATFLNTLSTQGLNESRLKSQSFPMPESGMKRHLPEDFSMRGLIWSQLYYPPGFFNFSTLEDDEERSLEPPSVTAPRTERCLWIGHRLASLDVWISFNEQKKKFIVKDFALELEVYTQGSALFDEAGRFFSERERVETKCDDDTHMTEKKGF
ncbi:conserved hypothetical protein [Coccidioides posadasii str. Silveira]|uniref:DNA/RNA-binding domain-containing protein n=2 Tax=Coccidioides posadasii (strain RMSCC 757 / Silveira) TaxID=443226 RepID=E9DJV3_COCPS|nr:conserved hypothetical protein [Coccidioides posadasii str. Silveira]